MAAARRIQPGLTSAQGYTCSNSEEQVFTWAAAYAGERMDMECDDNRFLQVPLYFA
jgi:hypothetical protein